MNARCLETRRLASGLKMRRYRREDDTEYKTIEMPMEVWAGINKQGHGHDRMAAWLRARKREALRAHAVKLVAEGWKKLAVAQELGLPERTVLRWTQRG